MATTAPTGTEFDAGQLIAIFPKNSREEVRVTLRNVGKVRVVDVRTWYPGPGDDFLPGKGLSLNVEKLSNLREALDLAAAALGAGQ